MIGRICFPTKPVLYVGTVVGSMGYSHTMILGSCSAPKNVTGKYIMLDKY